MIELPPIVGIGGGIGGSISFGLGIIISILSSLFGGLFGGPSASQINAALNQLRTSFSNAIDTVTRFAWTIANALGKLLDTIHGMLIGFLDQLWQLLKKIAANVVRILKEVLPAITKAVRALRATLDSIYAKYIRPVLAWIQLARRYLVILRLFHVKWAGQLDAILGKVQARIIGPFLYVLRTLNGIGNWVNLILTAGAVLQRPVFINTMYAYQRDWISMWWGGQANAPNAGTVLPPSAGFGPPSSAQVQTDFTMFVEADAGPYAADAARASQVLSQTLVGQ